MMQRLTRFDFHHALTTAAGVSVVLLTSPTCGVCRQWPPVLESLSGVRVFEVDVQQGPGLAHELEIFHLPALFVFRNGRFQRPLNFPPDPAVPHAGIAESLRLPAEETR